MPKAIEQKITGYKVKPAEELPVAVVAQMIDRADNLRGSTYKIKPVGSEHAWYITINDTVLPDGSTRPYEMFINTKDVAHFQWIQVMTRLISAVWRQGGEYQFIVEEMKAIIDPNGGYFAKGKGFMPSIVAHIGDVVAEHLRAGGK